MEDFRDYLGIDPDFLSPPLSSLETEMAIDYHPLIVELDTPVLKVVKWMSQGFVGEVLEGVTKPRRSANYVLVMEGDKLFGIFTERDVVQLVARGSNPLTTLVSSVITKNPLVLSASELTHPLTVLEIFRRHKIEHLPIVDERQQLVGVVTSDCLLQQQAINQTKLKLTKQALEYQIEFDRLVASISSRFIEFSNQEILESINQALQEIGEFTQVDTSYIFRYCDNQPTHSMTHEWVAAGIAPNIQNTQNLPLDLFPWATDLLKRGEIAYISNTDNLPAEAQIDRQNLQQFGIKSSLTIPLGTRDRVIGFVGFACFEREYLWSEDNIRLLKIFADILTNVLQRQEVETRLQASEQRYASLAEVAPVGIFRTDNKGNCLYVNDRWCQISGLRRETSLGMGWMSALHPNDRDRIANEWQRTIQNNIPFQQEYCFQRPDGQTFCVLGQAVAEYAANGQLIGYIGTITDISDRQRIEADRKAAETALQESEERFRAFMEYSPSASWISTAEGRLEYVSPSYYQMLLSPDNLVGKNVLDLYPPNIAQAYMESTQKVIRTGQKLETVEPGIRPDGSVGQFLVFKFPLPYLSGRIDVGGFAIDITERKAAEAALRDSEERLRLALSAGKQGLYDLNIQTGEVIVTPEYAIMLGYDPATFQETNAKWFARLHPDDRESVANTYQAYLAGTIPEYKIEFRLRTQSGEWKWILSLGKILEWDELGNPLRMLGTHTDITDLKQAQAALNKLNQELERRVVERTNALRESEERWQLAIKGANDGIWDWDVRTNQVFFSSRWKQMRGFAEDEIDSTLEQWSSAIHPDDYDRVMAGVAAHFAGETEFFEMEYRVRRKDGSYTWILDRGQALWNDSGQVIRMSGSETDISERMQLEAERQQTQLALAQYAREVEDLYNNAPCGYHSLDPDGRIITINNTELQWLGYTREEILNKSYAEVLTRESLAIFQTKYPEFKRRGSATNIELNLVCKDGSIFPVFLSSTAVKDDEGNYLHSRSTLYDARDRKQAEEILRISEERLQLALEGSGDGLWDWNFVTDEVYLSPRWLEMLGYDLGELPGNVSTWQQLIHPDDRPDVTRMLQAHLQDSSNPYAFEYRMQHKSGEWRWIANYGKIVARDPSGKPLRMVGIHRDINDRKQAEAKLQNLSDRFSLAIKSAAIAIWDWDIPQNILTWDDRMYELYGLAPDRFANVYDGWASRLHPDDRAITEKAIQQALTGEKDYDPEFRVVHPDGTIRFLKAYAIVQRNERGEPQRMVGINFDISDRKQAEAQLLQTTAQLQASNQELEAFAYSVSHDLRAPLRAIDGFSKALLEDCGHLFDDDAKDYFDRIRRNIQRMGMLIDDLLRLSRVSRTQIKYTSINLSDLVREQIEELQEAEPGRRVEVEIAANVVVSADLTLMRVVIANLIQNAWKFTSRHDTARIEFGVTKLEEILTYFVRDDGAGFDMAYGKMLFGVFQRLHNTNEFPGTGIGLATVQRVIHRHGGRVWAEGKIDLGATIYFTLSHRPL